MRQKTCRGSEPELAGMYMEEMQKAESELPTEWIFPWPHLCLLELGITKAFIQLIGWAGLTGQAAEVICPSVSLAADRSQPCATRLAVYVGSGAHTQVFMLS